MKMINLGCGSRFHNDWVNLDFNNSNERVINHNLLNGIPYQDESFDVVYHSHVLEHFSKSDAIDFIRECYRVLKPGGVIRIAVPDLEQISREYIRQLDISLNAPDEINENHQWMIIEMYDQTVRRYPGGDMAKKILSKDISNKDFIYSRLGEEAKNIWEAKPTTEYRISIMRKIFNKLKDAFYYLFGLDDARKAYGIGRYMLEGEIHQWMYDQYTLGLLLKDVGFKKIRKVTAFESDIIRWNEYKLDTIGEIIFKPDSLFMEASK